MLDNVRVLKGQMRMIEGSHWEGFEWVREVSGVGWMVVADGHLVGSSASTYYLRGPCSNFPNVECSGQVQVEAIEREL